MTGATDIKLLPPPKWLLEGFTDTTIEMLCDYTRACVDHATAAMDAEISEWRLAERTEYDLRKEAEAEVERLRADKLDLEAALEYLKSHREIDAMNQNGIIRALSEIRDEYGVEIHKLRAEVKSLQTLRDVVIENHGYWKDRAERLSKALRIAEAALADIGDADREPGDDLEWCERRAALGLRRVRDAMRDLVQHGGEP